MGSEEGFGIKIKRRTRGKGKTLPKRTEISFNKAQRNLNCR